VIAGPRKASVKSLRESKIEYQPASSEVWLERLMQMASGDEAP
jgi:hypothetical protein